MLLRVHLVVLVVGLIVVATDLALVEMVAVLVNVLVIDLIVPEKSLGAYKCLLWLPW